MINLPENWIRCKLDVVCNIYQPKTISTRCFIESGGYIVYGANGKIGRYNKYNHIDSEVLITCRGATCGRINISQPFSWINGNAMVVKPYCDNLNKNFLYYYLNSINFAPYISGSAQPQITRISLRPLNISIPPLAEQGRIVAKIEELFAGIDAGVENLKAVKNQIALYRQSVLKSAFNIKNAVIQKASEIGEVSLGRQRSPKNISKFYPTKYIRAANISENGIDVSDILDMEFLPYEKEKYLLKQNDILLSEASGSPNQVGKPAIWNNEIDDCCFQNTVIRHRLFSNHPKYVFWFYKYLYLSSFFAKLAGGVGINHIGSTKFSNIEIPIPSLDEQKRIVAEIESRFERADALETAVDRALSNAEKLKQAVLKKAFSGELVPQNPDDEPASVLLDRIRAARASELPAKKGKRKKTEVDSQL